jgi:hypothetical protein
MENTYDADVPSYVGNEESWKEGIHYDIHDRMHKISDMSDEHLVATIRHFKGLDTTPLEKEAKRRGLSY